MSTPITIQNRRDFLAAQAKGKSFVTGCIILQSNPRLPGHPFTSDAPRFGYTVTKKLGGAVVRNRIKRRLREAVRKVALPHAQSGHDYVLIARQKSIDCDFATLMRDMEFAFSKIIHHKGSGPARRSAQKKPPTPHVTL